MKQVLSALLLALSAPVFAANAAGQPVDAGRFYCGAGCYILSTQGVGGFLDGVPNVIVQELQVPYRSGGTQWVVGDKFTMCDGAMCVDLEVNNVHDPYNPLLIIRKKYSDPGAKYRNMKFSPDPYGDTGVLVYENWETISGANATVPTTLIRKGTVRVGPCNPICSPAGTDYAASYGFGLSFPGGTPAGAPDALDGAPTVILYRSTNGVHK